jgi:hypothetical protein
VKRIEPELLRGTILPTGVIVGSARIERCEEVRDQKSEVRARKSEVSDGASGLISDRRPLTSLTSLYAWHLTDIQRAKKLRKPIGRPQPVWFTPF